MTTLNEDLERMAVGLRAITQHPVDIRDNSVYVDFGYHEALVIEPEIKPNGKVWYVTAYAWDQSGGVSDEKEFAVSIYEHIILGVARLFLERQDKESEELERILAQMPDDL